MQAHRDATQYHPGRRDIDGHAHMGATCPQTSGGRHVQITADVNDDLEAWCELVHILANRPTHLRKLQPFPSTWIETTDESGSGMGGVCQKQEGQ